MKPREMIATLCISASCIASIAGYESFRPNAYLPTKDDVPTIGYGHTKGVKMGDKVTKEKAREMLKEDVEAHANGIKRCIKVPLYQSEWSAYNSLAFNIGTGAFCRSTIVKKLNQKDYAGACKQILRWDKQKGKVLKGLTKRRQEEYKLCISEHDTQVAKNEANTQ